MKRIFALFLIGLTAISMVGCGATTATESDTASDQSIAQSSDLPSPASTSGAAAIELSGTSADIVVGYPENTIQVNSSEKISVVPDIAEVVYSVRTENKDAALCQQNNSEAVAQIIELLKGLGIEEASIQTSDYYMNPIYNYSSNTAKVVGYEATTTLTVSDLAIDGLGDILTQSVSTGINTVQSITYQASRYDESYQEALTAAINSAHKKAQTLADAAGCTVGRVVNIQETSGYSEARYTDYARTSQLNAAKEEALADTTMSIMPGEIDVEASIVVEYQLINY